MTVRDPRIAFNAVLAHCTIRSQMPDMLDAVGDWKTHLHPCCSSSRSIFWPFHSSMLSLNSHSAPTKFDPLSHGSSNTSPQGFKNLRRHIIKSSVSMELTSSKCTLRVFRQVKRQHHRLAVPLPCLTYKGPNKSMPVGVRRPSLG